MIFNHLSSKTRRFINSMNLPAKCNFYSIKVQFFLLSILLIIFSKLRLRIDFLLEKIFSTTLTERIKMAEN
ncbi:hypothetical protein BpHYR1_027833 [Brachionus plicatilis]|uniref:Uncharacterized protein n=1 Tax=Brachionus plicatilis TaxID=10195 RepID=A0A3M7RI53_BRAPC|nr:hypothetical protein BpHYR1_027833 [Brachionus plicatilis]